MTDLTLYDYPASANCLKARILLAQLGRPYRRVGVDIFAGDTAAPEYRRRNPLGRTPVLELADGTAIAESGAILLYLAEGTDLLPADPVARARVHQWTSWVQVPPGQWPVGPVAIRRLGWVTNLVEALRQRPLLAVERIDGP